jgi:transcriptional regulator with XRE-family HTH domain
MSVVEDGSGSFGAAARLGETIRNARSGKYTLKQLSEAAGVSVGLISQLERGMGNPSFSTLQRIADALGLRIGDLVEAGLPPRDSTAMIVRRHARARLQTNEGAPVYELLTPNLRGRLEVLETTLPPGFSNRDKPFAHVGEECVVVLEGEVCVGVGEVADRLVAGDAITYDSAAPHWWSNDSDDPVRVIGVVTPPSF